MVAIVTYADLVQDLPGGSALSAHRAHYASHVLGAELAQFADRDAELARQSVGQQRHGLEGGAELVALQHAGGQRPGELLRARRHRAKQDAREFTRGLDERFWINVGSEERVHRLARPLRLRTRTQAGA
jgi:hypothetical protein